MPTWLTQTARQPALAPIGSVLGANDGGLALDRATWRRTWFKGGFGGTVIAAAYLATTRTGRSYVVAAVAEDRSRPLPETAAASMLAAIRAQPSPSPPETVLHLSWAPTVRGGVRRGATVWGRVADAVRDELVSRNVALLVSPGKAPRPRVVPVTDIEARALLAAAADDRLRVLWLVLLSLGLRCGEALALRGLVFTTSVGTALEPRNVSRSWERVCERAGLDRHLRIHDLRHAAASFLLLQGRRPAHGDGAARALAVGDNEQRVHARSRSGEA